MDVLLTIVSRSKCSSVTHEVQGVLLWVHSSTTDTPTYANTVLLFSQKINLKIYISNQHMPKHAFLNKICKNIV